MAYFEAGFDNTTDNFSATSNQAESKGSESPIDPDALFFIKVVLWGFFTSILSGSGMVTNTINVIVFYRQGILSDSSTVSLTALAVADFFCCLFIFFFSVGLLIDGLNDTTGYSWDVWNFSVTLCFRPRSLFTQITCWVTGYIAFERCFSVVFPFIVKNVFTAKRTAVGVTVLFVATIILYAPQYLEKFPRWVPNNPNNSTILRYMYSGIISKGLVQVFLYVNPVTLRTSSVVLVSVCNIIIFWKVSLSRKFRSKASSEKSVPSISISKGVDSSKQELDTKLDTKAKGVQREKKLLRMITMICIVFLCCYIPETFVVLTTQLNWSPHQHIHVTITMLACTTFLETLNSSCNIIIYYTMSTRYRETIHLVLCKKSV